MMQKKRVILTITRNSSHIWKYFFESYQRHCDEDIYDLCVWDNKSRPGDVEYLETFYNRGLIKAFFTNDANYLFTTPANRLLEYAHEHGYEQLILCNPDIEFKEGWDRDVEENQGVMGFVLVKPDGTIEHAGGFGGGEHLGRGEMDSPEKFPEIRKVDWVTFGAVAINRKVIDLIGTMEEEDYPHFGSDREYCRKSRDNGIAVTCSPARLVHGYGYSTRPYIFEEVPRKIWGKMVEERRSSGVYFPDGEQFILQES